MQRGVNLHIQSPGWRRSSPRANENIFLSAGETRRRKGRNGIREKRGESFFIPVLARPGLAGLGISTGSALLAPLPRTLWFALNYG